MATFHGDKVKLTDLASVVPFMLQWYSNLREAGLAVWPGSVHADACAHANNANGSERRSDRVGLPGIVTVGSEEFLLRIENVALLAIPIEFVSVKPTV